MYRDSGLEAELQRALLNGQQLALFGDGGYANRPWLQTPFRGQMGDEQRAFNAMMSSVRISVEWGFAKVKTLFAFTKLLLQSKTIPAATCQLLHHCNPPRELPHFTVWLRNFSVFRSEATDTR